MLANFAQKKTLEKGEKIMKIENETIVILPNGELTNGENIMRALKLEERILSFAKEGENNG